MLPNGHAALVPFYAGDEGKIRFSPLGNEYSFYH